MLARGNGFISFKMLRELFNLPEDALIVGVDFEPDGLTFHIVSEKEVKGKLHKVEYDTNIRRFSLNEGDLGNAVIKAIDSLRKQGFNHDS